MLIIHIRYLDLGECTYIKSLPRSIKKLELLTYLNLSNTRIRELPQWITNLPLLQSVDLSNCSELEKLPEQMYQMVGFRHLYIEGSWKLKRLPAMIGRLSRLRTLTRFIVAIREKEGNLSRSSDIGELRDLNLLRGSLEISNLENVEGRDDARSAKLEEKCSLSQLELKWTIGGDRDEEVLEGLCPPLGLVRLEVEGYGGAKFAGWMDQQGEVINCSKSSISSTLSAGIFSHLQELILGFCPNVSRLPRGLGLLPRLKKLTIEGLSGVKKVGSRELLGVADNHHHAVPVPAAGFFLHLEELSFKNMDDLEAWDDPPLMLLTSPKVDKVDGGNDPQVAAPMVMVMPRLRSLTLIDCRKLQALPSIFTTSLRELILMGTPLINMRFLPPQGIERIELLGMPTRRVLMESPSLPTLKYLRIDSDDDLTELPIDDLLRLTPMLRVLYIWDCRNLETLPEEMSCLQELEVMNIAGCRKLGDKCREGGLLWPNIRHIPTIKINGRKN